MNMTTSDDNFDPHKILSEKFNFDFWKDLNEKSPAEFEAKRAELMEAFIESSDESHKELGQRMLFQIDARRANKKTPMKNCIEISKMMWNSFHDLRDTLNGHASAEEKEKNKQRPADILEFKPREPD